MRIQDREALNVVTARFFKGLGEPIRLKILEFLEDSERSVTEIVEHLGLSLNHVSMHLGCLRWCGYVKTRKEGRFVYYSLGDSKVLEILSLAKQLLQGSETHLLTCEVIGKTDENLTNVTGWRGGGVKVES